MKKIIHSVMLAGIISMSACGNKTTGNAPQQDSVAVTDSVASDSLNAAEQTNETAEQQANNAAEQTAQAKPSAKSVEAGCTPSPWARLSPRL